MSELIYNNEIVKKDYIIRNSNILIFSDIHFKIFIKNMEKRRYNSKIDFKLFNKADYSIGNINRIVDDLMSPDIFNLKFDLLFYPYQIVW